MISGMPGNLYEWIQMGHRTIAGLIFLWVFFTMLIAIKHYKHQKIIYMGWIIAFILSCYKLPLELLLFFQDKIYTLHWLIHYLLPVSLELCAIYCYLHQEVVKTYRHIRKVLSQTILTR